MLTLDQDKGATVQVLLLHCTHSGISCSIPLERLIWGIYYVHLDRAQAVPVMPTIVGMVVPYKYAI